MPPKTPVPLGAPAKRLPNPVDTASSARHAGRAQRRGRDVEEERCILNVEGFDAQDAGISATPTVHAAVATADDAGPPIPVDAPAWVGAITQHVDASIRAVRDDINLRLDRLDARLLNGLAMLNDRLTPVTTAAGAIPQHFPLTRADMAELTGLQLTSLLTDDGVIPEEELEDRRRQFATYIGARCFECILESFLIRCT